MIVTMGDCAGAAVDISRASSAMTSVAEKGAGFFKPCVIMDAPGHARQCSKTKFRAAKSLGLLLASDSHSHSSIEFAILLCGEGRST